MARILVVEDDPMNAKLFQLVLSRKGGHEVLMAKDADDAVKIGMDPSIDLIIMDVSLQNWVHDGRQVDGIELTRLIKSNDDSRKTPVLLATAHAMKDDKERLLQESGAESYFAKPITNHGEFLSTVNSLLKSVGVA